MKNIIFDYETFADAAAGAVDGDGTTPKMGMVNQESVE